MNDVQVFSWLILSLALLLALNLKLTFTLYRKVRHLPGVIYIPEPLVTGTKLPMLSGKSLLSVELKPVWQNGYATAVLFLASRCSKCREKLDELPILFNLAEGSGLEIKLITSESARQYRRFLTDVQLARNCIRIRQSDYLQLNPQQMSPAYLFVDQQGVVEATGLIGDETWMQFCEQLQTLSNIQQNVA